MTALADREVISTKRALPIVTRRAALAAPTGVMIQGFRRRNLKPLRHARAHLMTVVAVRFLIVLCVAESDSERRHVLGCARISAQLMTSAAGRNIASI